MKWNSEQTDKWDFTRLNVTWYHLHLLGGSVNIVAFANKGKWHLKVGYDLYSNRNPHTCVLEEAKDLAGWYVCYLLRAFTGYISLIFYPYITKTSIDLVKNIRSERMLQKKKREVCTVLPEEAPKDRLLGAKKCAGCFCLFWVTQKKSRMLIPSNAWLTIEIIFHCHILITNPAPSHFSVSRHGLFSMQLIYWRSWLARFFIYLFIFLHFYALINQVN